MTSLYVHDGILNPKSSYSLYHCFFLSSSCLPISFPFHNRPFLSFISVSPRVCSCTTSTNIYNLSDYHQCHASLAPTEGLHVPESIHELHTPYLLSSLNCLTRNLWNPFYRWQNRSTEHYSNFYKVEQLIFNCTCT